MQGFNKYYPPDFDPKRDDNLNAYHGKHALGDRARKLDKGILITRFELPFNIWCGHCNAHIGMGVRYNAEKKKVGNYYSTPIWSFRCKCHLCDGWFEIHTDPQNTRYVVVSGARQKNEDWDAEADGSMVIEDKKDAPSDPFKSLEKTVADKAVALTAAARLDALESHNSATWSDPYMLSSKLRKSFRQEKRSIKEKTGRDDDVRTKFGLSTEVDLGAERADEEADDLWKEALKERAEREAEGSRKRKKLELEVGKSFDISSTSSSLSAGESSNISRHISSSAQAPSSSTSVYASGSGSSRPPSQRSSQALLQSRRKADPYPEPSSSSRRRLLPPQTSRSSASSSSSLSSQKSKSISSLTSRILLNTARKTDPFLKASSSPFSSSSFSSRSTTTLPRVGDIVSKKT